MTTNIAPMNEQSESNTRLHGRALWLVRIGFYVLVAILLLIGAASFLIYFTRDGWQICNGSSVECQVKLQYSAAQVADFARHGIPFETVLAMRYAALLTSSLVSLGLGLLIATRRSDDWMALLMALVLIQGATVENEGIVSSLTRAVPELSPLLALLTEASIPLIVLVFGLFPNGRPVPAWMRIGMPIATVLVLSVTLPPPPHPQWFVLVGAAVIIVVFGLLLYSQILRYRRFSTFAERKKTKWAVTGFVLVLLTYSVGITLFSLDPFGDNQLLKAIVGLLTFTLLPSVLLSVFLGIAILRSRLWDIDLIIRRTLIYSIITAMLALFYFGSVVVLQQVFRAMTGAGDDLAIIISTLGIAALFNPLRHRVQETIDHHFYRRKYDAQQVLARFAITARDEVELEKLTGALVSVVSETMQPTSISLWLKQEQRK